MLYGERTAQVYTRAGSIVINNPLPELGLPPDIIFYEQEVLLNPDGTKTILGQNERGAGITLDPSLISESFDLINPETGDVVGSMTYGEVQAVLFSLYFHATGLRDTRPPTEDPVVVDENMMPVTEEPLPEDDPAA